MYTKKIWYWLSNNEREHRAKLSCKQTRKSIATTLFFHYSHSSNSWVIFGIYCPPCIHCRWFFCKGNCDGGLVGQQTPVVNRCVRINTSRNDFVWDSWSVFKCSRDFTDECIVGFVSIAVYRRPTSILGIMRRESVRGSKSRHILLLLCCSVITHHLPIFYLLLSVQGIQAWRFAEQERFSGKQF